MKPPIVLVHGAWGGAWVWRRVLGPLRAAGHEVHAVTLTGDGERAHLLSPAITLRTHIDDVLGLVRAEELHDVVLVGHSYGGLVVTGAADALLAEQASRLRALVYVDAVVPRSGEEWGTQHTPEVRAQRAALAAQHGGALPPPDPEAFGLGGADRDWLLRRHVPHPFGVYADPLHFDEARWLRVPRTFIDCPAPALGTIAAFRQRVRAQPGWRLREIPTGHFPMVSTPQRLVELLLEAAEG